MKRAITPVPGGAALCQRMFTRIGCAGPPPAFRVEFYPYLSLVLTIDSAIQHIVETALAEAAKTHTPKTCIISARSCRRGFLLRYFGEASPLRIKLI